jgi:hypothetical protein
MHSNTHSVHNRLLKLWRVRLLPQWPCCYVPSPPLSRANCRPFPFSGGPGPPASKMAPFSPGSTHTPSPMSATAPTIWRQMTDTSGICKSKLGEQTICTSSLAKSSLQKRQALVSLFPWGRYQQPCRPTHPTWVSITIRSIQFSLRNDPHIQPWEVPASRNRRTKCLLLRNLQRTQQYVLEFLIIISICVPLGPYFLLIADCCHLWERLFQPVLLIRIWPDKKLFAS